MESFINSLPKPVLAVLVLGVSIILFFVLSPPHSVCDTQEATMRELQAGNIFATTVKKNKILPNIIRAKEACQLGNSPGSCYEYFIVLKKLANDVAKSSSECVPQVFNVNEVKAALNDGVEMMVRLAWGAKPPEAGLERLGWMQESELAIFCRLKNVYLRANGDTAWAELRKKISNKLPGEEVSLPVDPIQTQPEPKSAALVFSEQEIWNRSLFSLSCDNF